MEDNKDVILEAVAVIDTDVKESLGYDRKLEKEVAYDGGFCENCGEEVDEPIWFIKEDQVGAVCTKHLLEQPRIQSVLITKAE